MRTIRNKVALEADEALVRFREFLRERSLRVTDEREALARVAVARSGHFQVEDLVEDARQAGCEVSVATAYRAVPLLVEAGLIEATELTGPSRSYEATFGRPHHDHLICQKCNEVVEFHFEAFEMLQREVAAKYGYLLTGHVHELWGLCSRCRPAPEPSC